MNNGEFGGFHQKLKNLSDSFVWGVYGITQEFPREEVFGVTSQLRRAAMSVPLNLTEGYARQSKKELSHFSKIAYGSLKEALYIISFSNKMGWIEEKQYVSLIETGDVVAKMVWSIFSRIDKEKT